MSKIYEAIYEDGHLEWLGAQPSAGRHRLLVTVVDESPSQRSSRRGIACLRPHGVYGAAERRLRKLTLGTSILHFSLRTYGLKKEPRDSEQYICGPQSTLDKTR